MNCHLWSHGYLSLYLPSSSENWSIQNRHLIEIQIFTKRQSFIGSRYTVSLTKVNLGFHCLPVFFSCIVYNEDIIEWPENSPGFRFELQSRSKLNANLIFSLLITCIWVLNTHYEFSILSLENSFVTCYLMSNNLSLL